jgi:hypothetical protein
VLTLLYQSVMKSLQHIKLPVGVLWLRGLVCVLMRRALPCSRTTLLGFQGCGVDRVLLFQERMNLPRLVLSVKRALGMGW